MFNVYVNDKVIIFDSNAEKYNTIKGKKMIFPPFSTGWDAVMRQLEECEALVFISQKAENLFGQFLSQFRTLEAAGGLVFNGNGDILMIFRHKRWDLPKGKIEPGETPAHAAVREVGEECGIGNLAIKGERMKTYHLYMQGNEWILKCTHWYDMICTDIHPPVPQTEEDISAAEWVSPDRVNRCLRNSYGNIRDVFASAGFQLDPVK